MSIAPPQEAILQGYLHKRSKHLRLWKVRYFILTQADLLYSKKSGSKPKRCTAMHETSIIDAQNAVLHLGNHVIELRSLRSRVFLSAPTEQERAKWVMAMRSIQRDGSHHSANGGAGAGSSTAIVLLQRPASDSALTTGAVHGGAIGYILKSRRRRVSKDRREERKRRHLPKLKLPFGEVWVEEVLPSIDRNDFPMLEALCFAGVPKELRGRVWSWVLGNKLQINEELFNICKARACAVHQEMSLKKEADSVATKQHPVADSVTSLSSDTSSPSVCDSNENGDYSAEEKLDEELQRTNMLMNAVGVAEKLVARGERSIRLVGLDMPRTFGHHPLFHTGAEGTVRTTEVLEAYICYRPDLGYVQGMSYLAAALCFHMDGFTAFKALVSLMSNSVLFDMFRMEEKRTFHYIHAHDRILAYELPRLHAHFQDSGIEAQMYAVDWALSLFTRSLPLNLAFRIWDCFVLLGTPFFFQASMGLLSLFEDRLLSMQPEEIMRLLHHFPKTTTSSELFAAIHSVSLSCRDIDSILSGGDDRPWTPDSHRPVEVKYPDMYE